MSTKRKSRQVVPLTMEDLRSMGTAVDLTTAGRAFGIGRSLAYDLARKGKFPCPVLKLGSSYRVPTAHLIHALSVEDETPVAQVG